MMTIVHIGIMNDTGPTEQMDTVGKQRNEEKPSGKEFGQAYKTHTWPIDSSPSIAYLDAATSFHQIGIFNFLELHNSMI